VTLYQRFEKLSEEDSATRRRFLSRAAKACLGVAAAAAGLSRVEAAHAGGAGCCVLAYQNQCPNCTARGYDCAAGCTRWAWYCVDGAHHTWLCGECYSGGGCSGCSCGAVAIMRSSGALSSGRAMQ